MTSNDGSAESRYFDRRFSKKVARIGAVACAAVLLGDIAFLATVDPSHSSCPAWMLPGKNGTSIWYLVALVSMWAAWIGYCAVRWDWAAGRYVDGLERDRRLAERQTEAGVSHALTNLRIHRAQARVYYALTIDFCGLLTVIMIMSAFFCAMPVVVALGSCF